MKKIKDTESTIIKVIAIVVMFLLAALWFSCSPRYKVINKSTGNVYYTKGYLMNKPDTSIWTIKKIYSLK